jgi:hypothetical protein
MITIKVVSTRPRADGQLAIDGGETFASAYVERGWQILAVLPGRDADEVRFVVRQGSIAPQF